MPIRKSSMSSGTSFTVVAGTGGSKTATFSTEYPAGTYLIESKANDTNLAVYFANSNNALVGSCSAGAKTITASGSFIYVTTEGADSGDAITFTLKDSAQLATKTDATWAPPLITSNSPSSLPLANATTVISGQNFASDVAVQFRKSDNSTLVNAKSIVRNSSTELIATRPDTFSPDDSPYDIVVTNPTTGFSSTLTDAVTAGSNPAWVTSANLGTIFRSSSYSNTLQATDADGTISYSLTSGSLPTGISLSSSGVLSGTTTVTPAVYSFTVQATDQGNNTISRTFSAEVVENIIAVSYSLVAGGGGGGGGEWNGNGGSGGGGGAGAYINSSFNAAGGNTYNIFVGAGGSGGSGGSGSTSTNGTKGGDSYIQLSGVTIAGAEGGGFGGGDEKAGGNGGSGGGGGGDNGTRGLANNLSYGNNGASGGATCGRAGYGGGGKGSAGSGHTGGSATTDSITGFAVCGGGGGGGKNSCTTGFSAGANAGQGGDKDGGGRSGTANRGGGGGGGPSSDNSSSPGGSGGSGLVALRYSSSLPDAVSTTGSPSYSNSGGFKTYIWTSSGSISF
jgi:hypothetical protein